MSYKFGDIIKLKNGLGAKVLDDTGGEFIFVCVIISGWGDPHRHINRNQIQEATQ